MSKTLMVGTGFSGVGGITLLGCKRLNNISQLIKSLFANNEQGFAYDPNDLTKMFQDAAGTVPVTEVGQPVGLIRDKSGRNNHAYQTTSAARPLLKQVPILGNELVVNGDFSNGTVGWGTVGSGTPNWGISLGAATAALSNSASRYLTYLAGGTVTGKSYYVSFDVSGSNGTGGVRFGNGTDNSSAWFTGNGKVGFILTAGGATPNNLWFQANANWSGSVDNLSVKEITGYRTDRNYIEYDGVNDKLITNLPAQLNNCTVLRAIPNVGTQVKYNQTLPMLYEDRTNHSGLVAIDRALTRKEQIRLMEELDKKAGATSLETLTFKVFDNNQEGFVYDPNDLSTMFQDATGTIPVTGVGQPVGLVLDKSKGLVIGSEQIPQPLDFSTWSKTAAVTSAGGNTFTTNGGGGCTLSIFGVGNTKSYVLRVKGTSSVSGTLRNGSNTTGGVSFTAGAIDIISYNPLISTTGLSIYIALGSAGTITIDSISLKEVKGNHAYQTTSAARPILRQNAITKAYYLEFDGTDDFLMLSPFTLPSPFTLIASLDYTKTAVGAVFSGGVAGYLRSGITSAGVHSVSSPLTVSKRGKDTLTHSSKDAFVTLKSNMETTSLPIAESNPFGNTATKWIGTFSETHTALRCGMGLYGLVAISKSIDSSEENNIRALLNKRLGD